MTKRQVKRHGKQYVGVARHCMVVHAHYPHRETRVEREAQALISAGFSVDVICLRFENELAFETVDNVQVHRLPLRRRKGYGFIVQLLEYLAFFVLAFIQLAKLHWQRRYSVVQVHNIPDFLVFVALIPKLSGAKIILDLHDLMPEFYAERFQRSMGSLPVRLIRWQEKLACRFADHVITVTEPWRQSLISRGQPPDKITVVMNVANERFFHERIAPNPRGDDDRFRLFYHGLMGQRQGLDLAISAVERVRNTMPEVHLTLQGDGEYRPALEKMAEQLGLQDHVCISTRYIVTKDLAHLIRSADLAVVPYREGTFTGGILPTKLMEYAALGMPVIAAQTPAISAYFDDTMVQFFTPGDAEDLARCILTLHQDRARLEQLAQGIKTFNQRYNWGAVSAAYVDLVQRLGTR